MALRVSVAEIEIAGDYMKGRGRVIAVFECGALKSVSLGSGKFISHAPTFSPRESEDSIQMNLSDGCFSPLQLDGRRKGWSYFKALLPSNVEAA